MDLSGARVAAAPVRRQQRLLQHIGEDALALSHEVDARRRRLPAEETAQRLEILSGEEARRGHVGDDAARPGEPERQVGEQP